MRHDDPLVNSCSSWSLLESSRRANHLSSSSCPTVHGIAKVEKTAIPWATVGSDSDVLETRPLGPTFPLFSSCWPRSRSLEDIAVTFPPSIGELDYERNREFSSDRWEVEAKLGQEKRRLTVSAPQAALLIVFSSISCPNIASQKHNLPSLSRFFFY